MEDLEFDPPKIPTFVIEDATEVKSIKSTSITDLYFEIPSITSDLRLESISPLQSYISISSLKTMKSENGKSIQSVKEAQSEERNATRRKNICHRTEYIWVSLVCSLCAATVVFVWYQVEDTNRDLFIGRDLDQPMQELSNYSCPFWHITGDDYCDDEANIAQCGYDFKDCCIMQNDRTLCQDCFCYLPQEDKIKIEEKYIELCHTHMVRDNWGDGYCDLNHNNAENFFDVGDCCLEDLQCRLKFFNFTNFIPRFCPENTCIKSNTFCIPEELGDGICQDHNNGPFCDYDLGDCCLAGCEGGQWQTFCLGSPKNTTECCDCLCKHHFDTLGQFLLPLAIPDSY